MDRPLVRDLDDAAWSALLAATVDGVVRTLSREHASAESSEDIGHEVACRLLKYREAAVDLLSFRSLARSIARNQAVDRHRARGRAERLSRRLATIRTGDSPEEFAQAAEEKGHLIKVLREVLSALPPERRLLLSMRFIEDATYQGIAEALGISKSAVRRRIEESRTRIVESLQTRRMRDPVLDEILRSMGLG